MIGDPIRFYRAVPGQLELPPLDLGDLTLSTWKASVDGQPRGLFASGTNAAWYSFYKAGLFARDGLAVYAIHRGPRLLHRLLVTPRWYRFPFMAAEDLQLGMLWTDPEARGQGLARQAIAAVHHSLPQSVGALWYVVHEDNKPSIRLIERLGYRLAGYGVRTQRFGLQIFGQFCLTAPTEQA